MATQKKGNCIQCNKQIETGFQTKFCSRECWENYKKKHSLTVSRERQATIFLKSPFTSEGEIEKSDQKNIFSEKGILDDVAITGDSQGANLKEQTSSKTLNYIETLKNDVADKEKEIKFLKHKIRQLEKQLAQYGAADTKQRIVRSTASISSAEKISLGQKFRQFFKKG
ncbi:hypothetical protein ACFL27_19820 [candidate division CSSED10-310 bacterium]|uniref:DUF2116 family Zn-ribbon domain-containing protein n=1 Tax=candidate division CSSED10-310 bacterium TaxID=2855610 RepID=A0ABV6Z206_UNCC1